MAEFSKSKAIFGVGGKSSYRATPTKMYSTGVGPQLDVDVRIPPKHSPCPENGRQHLIFTLYVSKNDAISIFRRLQSMIRG